jgi:hypothetical protein
MRPGSRAVTRRERDFPRNKLSPIRPSSGEQMSITSAEGVAFAASLGVTRMVVGRELTVKEIEKVRSLPPHGVHTFTSAHSTTRPTRRMSEGEPDGWPKRGGRRRHRR